MEPVGKPDNLKSDHRKGKKGFFRGVSKWLIGTAKPKRKTEETPIIVPTKTPIPYDEDPKLVDTDIVKTSAKEYDASDNMIPTSLEIKAKLIAVDNYYGLPRKPEAGRNAPFLDEQEKERPSWGYIMERPLVEQYVLMNNYIRKASVLAELENIEEEEKTGKKEGLKEYETDTDISLPSDYETELNLYNQFRLSKAEERKKASIQSKNEGKKSIKSILRNENIFDNQDIAHDTTKQKIKKTYRKLKKFSHRKRTRVIKIPSDSDPPISYDSIPSIVEKFRKIGKTDRLKNVDKSGILTNLGFNLESDTPPQESLMSDVQEPEIKHKPSIMKGRGLSDVEIEAFKIYKEQKQLLKKVSSPYVANLGEESDDSIPKQPQVQQKNVDFASQLNVYEYEQQEDLISDIVKVDEPQSPQIKEQVKSEEPIKRFKPSNIISPLSVLRIQTEQAKHVPEDLSDKVLKVLTNKKYNQRHRSFSLTNESKAKSHETRRFSFMKDFGTHEFNHLRDSTSGKKVSQEPSEINSEPSSIQEKSLKIDKSIGPKQKIMVVHSPVESVESLTPNLTPRNIHSRSEDEKEMIRKSIILDRPDTLWGQINPRRNRKRSISCESRTEYRRSQSREYRRSQSVENEKFHRAKISQAEFRALLIEQPECSTDIRNNDYENRHERIKDRYVVSPDRNREILYSRQESDSDISITENMQYQAPFSEGMQTTFIERKAMWVDTPLFYDDKKPSTKVIVERTAIFDHENPKHSQISDRIPDERRKPSSRDSRIINLISEDFELNARIKLPQEEKKNMKRKNTFIRE